MSNFKDELAAFARDMKAICEDHTCSGCPLRDEMTRKCMGCFSLLDFNPEAVIAAVEDWRKRNKPCPEIIDKALDVYTIEIEVERERERETGTTSRIGQQRTVPITL